MNNNENEEKKNDNINEIKNNLNENNPNDNNDNNIDNPNYELLSDSRIDVTFSHMNESQNTIDSVETYQSVPFQEMKLDLDLPNFSPTKYETTCWKFLQSSFFFLFVVCHAIANYVLFNVNDSYHVLLLVSSIFYIISSLLEWCHFRRGCIGYSNLNSSVKKNIDKSFKAKILRSEYGIKYWISVWGALMLFFSSIYYYVIRNTDNKFYVIQTSNFGNFFGMVAIGLSQILKLEKMLKKNKTNYLQSDKTKFIIEIFIFFGSLLVGGSYMIEIIYQNADGYFIFYIFAGIRAIGNIIFIVSSFVIFYRFYGNSYKDFNIDKM